jgi:hypothetical protein
MKEREKNEEVKQYSSMMLFAIVLYVVYDHLFDVNDDMFE